MKKNKRVLYGFKHETLEAKIRYMLSLSLAERLKMGFSFTKFFNLLKRDRGYEDAKRYFRTVQVIKKK